MDTLRILLVGATEKAEENNRGLSTSRQEQSIRSTTDVRPGEVDDLDLSIPANESSVPSNSCATSAVGLSGILLRVAGIG